MDAQHIGRTVVVGVDGSDSALRAVRWGAAEAGRRQAPLRLVFAFPWSDDVVFGPGSEAHYRDTLLENAHSHLGHAVAAAEQEQPGLDVSQQLVVGNPIDVLGAEAERAHLMVLGDRGLSRVEGLLAGSVSYALYYAGLIDGPHVSGDFMAYGEPGPGKWITIYANPGHMYMEVAGIRFDTSGQRVTGSRWQNEFRSTSGFVARHPAGL